MGCFTLKSSIHWQNFKDAEHLRQKQKQLLPNKILILSNAFKPRVNLLIYIALYMAPVPQNPPHHDMENEFLIEYEHLRKSFDIFDIFLEGQHCG